MDSFHVMGEIKAHFIHNFIHFFRLVPCPYEEDANL